MGGGDSQARALEGGFSVREGLVLVPEGLWLMETPPLPPSQPELHDVCPVGDTLRLARSGFLCRLVDPPPPAPGPKPDPGSPQEGVLSAAGRGLETKVCPSGRVGASLCLTGK